MSSSGADDDGCSGLRLANNLNFAQSSGSMLRYLRNKFLGEAVQHSQIGRAGQVHNYLLYAQGLQSVDTLTNRGGTANQGGLSEFWFEDIWNQSQRLFVAIGDGAERTGGAVDALVVAS